MSLPNWQKMNCALTHGMNCVPEFKNQKSKSHVEKCSPTKKMTDCLISSLQMS